MGIVKGLKGLNQVMDKPSYSEGDGTKARWAKLEDAESVKIRFLSHLDILLRYGMPLNLIRVLLSILSLWVAVFFVADLVQAQNSLPLCQSMQDRSHCYAKYPYANGNGYFEGSGREACQTDLV